MIGIYKIISPSNKIYIGQAINIKRRFKDYKTPKFKGQTALLNSFKKYGVNNHKFEIIEECLESQLNERERYWQDYYDVCNSLKGLNCKLVKTNDKSGKCSLETIERIRKASIGNTSNCKKIIDTSTGIIYNSIKSVAEIFNLNYKTLSMKLTGYYKNNTTFNYLKKYNKMEMSFGIPAVRQQKNSKIVEKYNDKGVVTFLPTGPGLGRKMELNSYGKELLNLTDTNNQVSFSFSGADIYIVNTSGADNCSGLKVGKTTNIFTDKKHYEFIKNKTYNFKDEDTLELFLEETENQFNGNKVYKLVKELSSEVVLTQDLRTSPCTNHNLASEEINELEVKSTEELYTKQ